MSKNGVELSIRPKSFQAAMNILFTRLEKVRILASLQILVISFTSGKGGC